MWDVRPHLIYGYKSAGPRKQDASRRSRCVAVLKVGWSVCRVINVHNEMCKFRFVVFALIFKISNHLQAASRGRKSLRIFHSSDASLSMWLLGEQFVSWSKGHRLLMASTWSRCTLACAGMSNLLLPRYVRLDTWGLTTVKIKLNVFLGEPLTTPRSPLWCWILFFVKLHDDLNYFVIVLL